MVFQIFEILVGCMYDTHIFFQKPSKLGNIYYSNFTFVANMCKWQGHDFKKGSMNNYNLESHA